MRGGQAGRHEAAERLRPQMFTGRRQHIAKEVLGLIEEGMRPDFHTVSGRLGDDLQQECQAARDVACTPANYPKFFDSVRAAHLRRRMMHLGERIVGEALDMETGSLELAEAAQEKAERGVLDLSGEVLGGEGARPASDITDGAMEMLRAADEETLTGVTTGFRELDRITRGWQKGWFNVIAARTSMGKSALMGQCATAAALGKAGVRYKGSYDVEPTPVAIFSLEMPAEEIMMRMICEQARVDGRKKDRTDEEWRRIVEAKTRLDEAPIFIDDEPGVTPREVSARLRRLVREEGVGCAWVDYLQIMGAPRGMTFDKQVNRLGHAARKLRDLAKDLSIPINALSQVNRGVESSGGSPRPRISDIRESGEIEEAANLVGMLYRPMYYGIMQSEDGEATQTNIDGQQADVTEFIIGKQKGGEVGTRELAFVQKQAAFRDLDPRQRQRENRPSYAQDPQDPEDFGAPTQNGASAPVPSGEPPF